MHVEIPLRILLENIRSAEKAVSDWMIGSSTAGVCKKSDGAYRGNRLIYILATNKCRASYLFNFLDE
jgi:hypothetical protein